MPEQKEVKEEKKEPKLAFTVGQVVTGTAPAILYENNPVTLEEAIALILNKLDKIEKSVA